MIQKNNNSQKIISKPSNYYQYAILIKETPNNK